MMPYGQNTVHITYRLLGGSGPVRLSLRPSVQFRPHEAPVGDSPAHAYGVSAVQNRYELSGGSDLPVLRLMLRGHRAALTLDEHGVGAVPYEMERVRGYQDVGSLWSPGYFRADLTPDEPVTLIGSTELWDTVLAMTPEDAIRSEWDRRERLLGDRGDCRRNRPCRGTRACRRSVHHHAGRSRRRSGARPRSRRRGAHGDRRLPLVHRLGARHDDQPRGADVAHGTLPRGRLHPAHLRPLRSRWADPQHVSGWLEGRAVPHGRRVALVLPRRWPLRACHRRSRDAASPSAYAHRYRRASSPRHPIRYRCRFARRVADARR